MQNGYECLLCLAYLTCDHKVTQQLEGRDWSRCAVQSFFAKKQHIPYFVVNVGSSELSNQESEQLEPAEREFCEGAAKDSSLVKQDA